MSAFATKNVAIINIEELIKSNASIEYTKVHDREQLHLPIFPIASAPNTTHNDPVLPETFILKIPHGQIYGKNGLVIIDNQIIDELLWPWSDLKKKKTILDTPSLGTLTCVKGSVAVFAQEGSHNYYHWLLEVLPKLALLENKNIEYDYLYLPDLSSPFMLDSLLAMGINKAKILIGKNDSFIEAEMVIAPSFISRSYWT